MTHYQNYSGASNVHAYEISSDAIVVAFKDGSAYLYNTSSTSPYNIAEMQRRAVAGRGLNSFISTTVKKGYAAKLR